MPNFSILSCAFGLAAALLSKRVRGFLHVAHIPAATQAELRRPLPAKPHTLNAFADAKPLQLAEKKLGVSKALQQTFRNSSQQLRGNSISNLASQSVQQDVSLNRQQDWGSALADDTQQRAQITALMSRWSALNLTFLGIPRTVGSVFEDVVDHTSSYPVQLHDGSVCSKSRVPRKYLFQLKSEVNDNHTESSAGSNTFCITSHPYERAVLQYTEMIRDAQRQGGSVLGSCTKAGLNSYLREAFQEILLKGNKFVNDCTFLPQAEFFEEGHSECTNVLRHDALPAAFNRLMDRSGWSIHVPPSLFPSSTVCDNLKAESIDLTNKRLLNRIYHEDFRSFGYKKRVPDMFFLHIPRNAGWVLKSISADWVRSISPGWPRNANQSLAQASCERFFLPPDMMYSPDMDAINRSDNFCVVRHPYDRALSLYTYFLTVPDGVDITKANGIDLYAHAPCSEWGLNSFLQAAFNLYNANNGSAPGQQGVPLLNCQMLPQSRYVWGSDGKQYCHNIIRSENLEASFAELMHTKGFWRMQNLSSYEFPRRSKWRCPHLSVDNLWEPTTRLIKAAHVEDFLKFQFAA